MSKGLHFEDMADFILEEASKQGASYCDARVEEFSNETINVEGKLLKSTFNYSSSGAGVRVIADGAWGFASMTNFDHSSLEEAVSCAMRIGRSAGERRKTPVRLRKIKPSHDNITTKVKVKFSNVAFEDKVKTLVECNKRLKPSDEVVKTTATLVEVQSHKYIVSSEGSKIDFEHSITFGTLSAYGVSSGISESATVELGGSGGCEVMEPSSLLKQSEDVGARVIHLLRARACPNLGRTQIVIDPSYIALLVHEIIGHPSEADRVLGWEHAWGGGAWWQGMLGQQVGAKILNAVDEGDIKGTLGYTPYDDEGVKCVRNYLIKDGILVGHIQSRQTAENFGVDASGGMRSFSFSCIPLIRMSNTYILGGEWKRDEIVEETKDGILVKHFVNPSIDDRRYRWVVAPQEAYSVKNGEVGELYRGAVVMGVAPEFFRSIDAVGKDMEIRPLLGCGKGDPEQLICCGNGGPTVRATASVVGRGE